MVNIAEETNNSIILILFFKGLFLLLPLGEILK